MTAQTIDADTTKVGLSAQDRCDRCGAQAYMEVEIAHFGGEPVSDDEFVKPNGSARLLFCAHHAREHGEALKEQAIKVVDYTASLDEQNEKFKGVESR